MKIVSGDLIQLAKNGEFDLIVHGCNCFCTMGAGIAKGIKVTLLHALLPLLLSGKANGGRNLTNIL